MILNNDLTQNRLKIFFVFFLGLVIGFLSEVSWSNTLTVHLSGDLNYPGYLSASGKSDSIKLICLLGKDAKGNIAPEFLENLKKNGIPKGEYAVSQPLSEELWPEARFVKSGALRLKAVSSFAIKFFSRIDKQGIAIHGRDFYPVLQRHLKNKKMIAFYNREFFDRVRSAWGPIRITNWDMGRFFDFWKRNLNQDTSWTFSVSVIPQMESISRCKSPVTKRKP